MRKLSRILIIVYRKEKPYDGNGTEAVGLHSSFAGCIANALLDKDIPVLMTNFPTLLNRLTGLSGEERSALIAELDDYALLILDDWEWNEIQSLCWNKCFRSLMDGIAAVSP